MPLRIGFMGASGTGKSTLAEWVAETYGVPQNPVGSRSVAKAMGYDSPYDVDRAGKRIEFQRRLVEEKVAWEKAHESFVTDRTTFDNLAYSILHAVHDVNAPLLDAAVDGFDRYTYVFLCPLASFCHLGADPARVLSLEYQRCFEMLLRGIVGERDHWPLTSSRLDRRKMYILSVIGRPEVLREIGDI